MQQQKMQGCSDNKTEYTAAAADPPTEEETEKTRDRKQRRGNYDTSRKAQRSASAAATGYASSLAKSTDRRKIAGAGRSRCAASPLAGALIYIDEKDELEAAKTTEKQQNRIEEAKGGLLEEEVMCFGR